MDAVCSVVQLKDYIKDHLNDHINFSTFKSDSFKGIIIQIKINSLNRKKLYSQLMNPGDKTGTVFYHLCQLDLFFFWEISSGEFKIQIR